MSKQYFSSVLPIVTFIPYFPIILWFNSNLKVTGLIFLTMALYKSYFILQNLNNYRQKLINAVM